MNNFVIFATTLLYMGCAMSGTAQIVEKDCIAKWESLVPHGSRDSHSNRDYPRLLSEWKKLTPQCTGTGYYEYRLATLYERNGQLEKAVSTVDEGLRLESNYEHMLKFGKYLFRFIRLVSNGNKEIKEYEAVLMGLKSITTTHPNWSPPYEQMSTVQGFIGRVDEAISSAEKAVELNKASWSGHRSLVIHHTERKEYKKAKLYIMEAIELKESLLSDQEFMLASSVAYIKIGELKSAGLVLSILFERLPSIEMNDRFRNIVAYLKQEKYLKREKESTERKTKSTLGTLGTLGSQLTETDQLTETE